MIYLNGNELSLYTANSSVGHLDELMVENVVYACF